MRFIIDKASQINVGETISKTTKNEFHSSDAETKTNKVIHCKNHLRDRNGHNAHNTEKDNGREEVTSETINGDPETVKDELHSSKANTKKNDKCKKHLRDKFGRNTYVERNNGRKESIIKPIKKTIGKQP